MLSGPCEGILLQDSFVATANRLDGEGVLASFCLVASCSESKNSHKHIIVIHEKNPLWLGGDILNLSMHFTGQYLNDNAKRFDNALSSSVAYTNRSLTL